METEREKKGRGTSYVTGVVALVFLIVGYQTALFVHRAAVLEIISNRDHPDTVYVMDREMAEAVITKCGMSGLDLLTRQHSVEEAVVCIPSGDSGCASGGNWRRSLPESLHDRDLVVVRKTSEHSPLAGEVRRKYSRRRVESFAFDPNTVGVDELVRLGFTLKQAEAIDNYRKKGGRFRRREDFSRSFVVADSVYRRLEPYINIPLVDLNLADSAAFDALPGIGGYFAAMMVSYRNRLGGSYSYKEQLMDIYRFDREKFDGLADLVTVSPEHVRPYPLWSLPEDSLALHPYIGRYSAHAIVLFRENNPAEQWTVGDLAGAGILKPEMAGRLSRCSISGPEE